MKYRLPFAALLGLLLGLAQAAPLKLRLLATTDIHMNLVNYDYYQDKETEQFGLAKTATLIKAARAEVKNHLLIDNGDLIQGSPMGEVVARIKPLQPGQVHPAYLVMNALKYDAANVGNHEFNYGLPFLLQSLKTAAYFALGAPVAIILGLVPFLGPLLALGFTGHRVAFQNTDAVLLRRGLDFQGRRAFHRQFRPETVGFGVAAVLLFPLMNILAVPAFVVGATRLVNDLEAFRDTAPDEERAAISVTGQLEGPTA